MSTSVRIDSLERRVAELRRTVEDVCRNQGAVHEDIEELFSELAQALDIVSASLEDLIPEEEREAWSDATGIMGRACELQALVRIFRGNLADLHHRLAATKPAPAPRALRPS